MQQAPAALDVDLCGNADEEQQVADLRQHTVGAVKCAKDGDITIGAEVR